LRRFSHYFAKSIIVFDTKPGSVKELASEGAMGPLHATISMCRWKNGIRAGLH